MRHRLLILVPVFVSAWVAGCGSTSSETPATACDQACVDSLSIRAVRQTLRLIYNLKLQGGDVGEQDVSSPCPNGGSVHVTGTATSNAKQGTTEVDLAFDFTGCAVVATGTSAFDLTIDGVVNESGVLPSSESNTALLIDATQLTLRGTVSDPAIPVDEICLLALSQSGALVSGTICDRPASFSF